MPVPVPLEYRKHSRSVGGFRSLYGAYLLLTFHWSVVLYVNSSYVAQFVSPRAMSVLYIGSAVLTIIAFLYASELLSLFGNIRTAATLTILEFMALFGMAFNADLGPAIAFFLVHQTVVPILLFNLDVIIEELIGEREGTTGERRGLLLTIMSLTGALAALGMGFLLGEDTPNFRFVYLLSACTLVPFFWLLIVRFGAFKDPHYPPFKMFRGIAGFWKHADLRNVFFAHFLLQLFFTWMVIYTPLYLASEIGLNWKEIGIVLFIGLLAYVFLEYPIGVVADRFIGEKEMMAFGFAIMAISTSWFSFLDGSSVIVWMLAMFMTRVGAAFVETTTESYFFKHTAGKDTNIIGLFRITRPLSYVVGAFFGTLLIRSVDFEALFLILGLAMVAGLFFAMKLNDTR